MNLLQRWLRRLAQALAVLRDPDAGLLLPLPPPLIDPRLGAEELTAQARGQGRVDGRQCLYDGWSFGDEDDPPGTIRAPAYVEELRQRCEGAVHEYYDRQQLTEARLADLHLIAWDAERDMRAARMRMARIAAHDQLNEEDSLRSFLRRKDVDPDQVQLPPLGHPVWEGDAPPMRPIWRVSIVTFLFAVVFVIERYVGQAYLPLGDLGQATGLSLTGAIAGLTVLGPLVSGQLFRNRHATGYDAILAALTFVLLLPTLTIVLGFGLLAGELFDRGVSGDTAAAAARNASVGLTPATLIVVFDVVLFLAGAMAYTMGLAQPHPFQQVFARNRRTRDQAVRLIQRMGTRINEDYRVPLAVIAGADQENPRPESGCDQVAAIRHAYGAAEDAYYQGLITAAADPTFTEAIMRRRTRPFEARHE